ncbi:MAG: NYN domain-containing protein [Gemmatimonadaceae bacterium]
MHRAPQGAVHAAPPAHAPNAALLIDFDNVTMGIQKDLHTELRKLLSSEIIRGKVAVQRAYADWRRYPQYIVPLAESSIDMIMAPAYGSSKKNATDIRLAIDALELVFTRPEIGTFILLSGDSDFSSLVIKLKEYGKYVIGVGIRESSSDLLVMNCDEYYSWNALTGLVKTDEDEPSRKYDPWELLTEAVQRMKRNGDVMRSDRLKQVMQEIDASFDEKEYGYSKFSRFCQEAAGKGLLAISKLENGQLEVDVPGSVLAGVIAAAGAPAVEAPRAERDRDEDGEDRGARRRGRGRGRGRDRDRDREPREGQAREGQAREGQAREERPREERPRHESQGELRLAATGPAIGVSGERLTREEAFDLVRRATAAATSGDQAARADDVRAKARELLGHDSESLSERNFSRILRDAHDAEVIDLRRRGEDFEVARAAEASPAAEPAKSAEPAPPVAPAAAPPLLRGVGLSGRGVGPRGRAAAIPPELLSIGIVPVTPVAAPAAPAPATGGAAVEGSTPATRPAAKKGGRGGRGAAKKSTAKKSAPAAAPAPAPAAAAPAAKAKRAGKTAAKQAPAAKREGKSPGRAAKTASSPAAKREGKARTAE